ncbi:MAG: TolC family protein, partial [Chlorobi bacterium]|nr:TolC family protein [Chlorobiota bacterium]
MKNIIAAVVAFMFITGIAGAQSGIDRVLQSVEAENLTLKAERELMIAKGKTFRTGYYPSNTEVSYSKLFGENAVAGDKEEFGVSQSFEFPTVYFNKLELAKKQQTLLAGEFNDFRRNILYKTAGLYYRIIHANQSNNELARRLRIAEDVKAAFEIKYRAGDIGVLDLNKSDMNLLKAQTEFDLNAIERAKLLTDLRAMNGGKTIELADTVFPKRVVEVYFDQAFGKSSKSNPYLKQLHAQIEVSRVQADVTSSSSYPKINLGFRNVNEGGFNFSGFAAGISIPLYENINKTDAAELHVKAAEIKLESYLSEYETEMKAAYEKVRSMSKSVKKFREMFGALDNTELLRQSLELGNISTLEYFLELEYYSDMK